MEDDNLKMMKEEKMKLRGRAECGSQGEESEREKGEQPTAEGERGDRKK